MLSMSLADRVRADLVAFLGQARFVGLVDADGIECTYGGYQRQFAGAPALVGDAVSFPTVTFASVLDTVGRPPVAWCLFDSAGLPLAVGAPHSQLDMRLGDVYQATPRVELVVTINGS